MGKIIIKNLSSHKEKIGKRIRFEINGLELTVYFENGKLYIRKSALIICIK
jgi:hypothetical protein